VTDLAEEEPADVPEPDVAEIEDPAEVDAPPVSDVLDDDPLVPLERLICADKVSTHLLSLPLLPPSAAASTATAVASASASAAAAAAVSAVSLSLAFLCCAFTVYNTS
jgi:hypothetical protein